jgi:cell wall-associated NlpC family hydrolase
VDRKATSAPVDIRGWLADMSTTARRGLVGRVETQALYGDRLVVTAVRPGWLHVVTPSQPSHRDSRGYPGWIPQRQVTTTAPTSSTSVATVTRLTTWLRSSSGGKVVEVSFGTRLPVLSRTSAAVTVASPTHRRLVVPARDVAVGTPTAPAMPRTASSVLASARTFLGRPYLWGGRSGFAVDCSGFTSLVFAAHGRTIPRDADDQANAGAAAALSALRPADLLFFRSGGAVTHVGFYLGSGRMLHAPHTGTVVQVGGMGQPAKARRYLAAGAADSG